MLKPKSVGYRDPSLSLTIFSLLALTLTVMLPLASIEAPPHFCSP